MQRFTHIYVTIEAERWAVPDDVKASAKTMATANFIIPAREDRVQSRSAQWAWKRSGNSNSCWERPENTIGMQMNEKRIAEKL